MTEPELTRLMYEIISNPECGRLYLKLFDKHVLRLEMSKAELNSAKVYGEYPTQFIGRTRYIDLAIITSKRFIPIEVKIEAGSGKSQCDDYWREAQLHTKRYSLNESPVLYYLTLHGYFPERASATNMGYGESGDLAIHQDKIIKVTFRTELLPWLEDCAAHAPENSYCKDNLSRLLSFVRKITQRTQSQLQVEEIMREFFIALEKRFDENFCRRYHLKRKSIQHFGTDNYQREILKFFFKGYTSPEITFLCSDAADDIIKLDNDKNLWFCVSCYNGGENTIGPRSTTLCAGFAIFDNSINNGLYRTVDVKRLLDGKNILPQDFIEEYWQKGKKGKKLAGCIGLTELHDAHNNTIDFYDVDKTLRQFRTQEDIARAVEHIMIEIKKLLRRFIYG